MSGRAWIVAALLWGCGCDLIVYEANLRHGDGGGPAPRVVCLEIGAGEPVPCTALGPCGTLDLEADVGWSATRTATLSNCGTDPVELSLSPLLTGSPDLLLSGDVPTRVTLAPGASMPLDVSFSPRSAGTALASLAVETSDPALPLFTVDLRGNGDSGLPSLRCSTGPLSLGEVTPPGPARRNLVCRATTAAPVTVASVSLTGAAALGLVGSALPRTLPPGGSATFQLTCATDTPAVHQARLSIASDACGGAERAVDVLCRAVSAPALVCTAASLGVTGRWSFVGQPASPSADDVLTAPVVVGLSDDNADGVVDSRDVPDVVFVATDYDATVDPCRANLPVPGLVMALRGDNGTPLWTYGRLPAVEGDPQAYGVLATAGLAAADLDGDGAAEIVAVEWVYQPAPTCSPADFPCCLWGKYATGRLVALESDGARKWVSDPFHLPTTALSNPGAPAVGDALGDPAPEIAFGNALFTNDGFLLFEPPESADIDEGPADAGPASTLTDLDGDGYADLLAGRSALRGDGTVLWNRTDLADGASIAVQLDADPLPEVLLHGIDHTLVLLDANGATVAGTGDLREVGDETYAVSPPAVADLDADGLPEVVVAAGIRLRAFTAELGAAWSASFASVVSAPVVVDLDGDGAAEVLVTEGGHIRVLAGDSGAERLDLGSTSGSPLQGLVVADADGDGHADVVVPEYSLSSSGRGLRLLAGAPAWAPVDRVWPQYLCGAAFIDARGVVSVPSSAAPRVVRGQPLRCF